MGKIQDKHSDRRGGGGPLCYAVRLSLIVYTSPIILIVLAIGLAGMLVERLLSPSAKRGIEAAAARPCEQARPLGIRATLARA